MPTRKIRVSQPNIPLTGANDPLEKLIQKYVVEFIANNRAAHALAEGLRVLGVGFRPVIDHITFRTIHVDARAEEFIKYGYAYDASLGVIEYDTWWAKVYRKQGYPTIFIDQAYEGSRGKGSPIPDWVHHFGENHLHHVAVMVDDIENAVFYLEKQGIEMTGNIVGDKGTDLRQIFTKAEVRRGKPFTVLELAERHRGYTGFLPPQAHGLMESTRQPE